MNNYGGVEVQLKAFLTSALRGSQWSVSHLGRFTPEERTPDTHWIGVWMQWRREKFLPLPRIEPQSSSS